MASSRPYRLLSALVALVIVSAPAGSQGATPALDSAWGAYVEETNGKPLQFGCQPRRYRPPPGVERVGTVVAFHGFSACPQQFFQLAPVLANLGFDVLVPMLPGHGLERRPDGQELLEDVPTAANWRDGYGALAARMNDIVALARGPRVVVGYSLGGAIALNAGFRAPALYDRMLLIAPLIRINMPEYLETTVNIMGRIPLVRDWQPKPESMEVDCESWTAAGRAGFCDYSLVHIPPLVELERQNGQWQQTQPIAVPMFVITSDEDRVVSNDAVRAFVDDQAQHGPIELCELTGGVPHEVLTPYENAGRKMFWLPEFFKVAPPFVLNGETTACSGANP